MTTEQKPLQLLLIDLCARLPYYTVVSVDNGKYHEDMQLCPYHLTDFNSWVIRPYLRPMSSMTKEEKETLNNILEYQYCSDDSCMCESTDWLNAHHFDYRGLIEKGLALEAPKGMYEIK